MDDRLCAWSGACGLRRRSSPCSGSSSYHSDLSPMASVSSGEQVMSCHARCAVPPVNDSRYQLGAKCCVPHMAAESTRKEQTLRGAERSASFAVHSAVCQCAVCAPPWSRPRPPIHPLHVTRVAPRNTRNDADQTAPAKREIQRRHPQLGQSAAACRRSGVRSRSRSRSRSRDLVSDAMMRTQFIGGGLGASSGGDRPCSNV